MRSEYARSIFQHNLIVSTNFSYQSKNGQSKQPSIHAKNIKGSSQDLPQFSQSFQSPIVALSPSPRNAQRYCIPNITITIFQQTSPSNMLANQPLLGITHCSANKHNTGDHICLAYHNVAVNYQQFPQSSYPYNIIPQQFISFFYVSYLI